MSLTRSIQRWLRATFRKNPDYFLNHVPGVLHVGGNMGQEIKDYAALDLPVLWIEPIPEVFATLEKNIAPFPKQRAIQALITDKDGAEYQFNVANNDGGSSSIFDFKEHRELWPDVEFERTIQLESVTLPTLFKQHDIDPSGFGALMIDTQGSELLVLKSLGPMLSNFSYVKTEAADFEAYDGGCTLEEIDSLLLEHGFIQDMCKPAAKLKGSGTYFEVLYRKPTAPGN